ncbi:PadR family transcriptional regulator [Bacillus sp. CHD6a]|uniref:PadR family transcriptional regulator n=1 Tax=Bacillus sp. CHD6a TaxID=1643452 RepID=UPI0006CD62CB|nr:PadR family transcriptional regulator [Bacillus sp. CHD6a]KPB06240.1 PadR family transcriptional regulator [Bacillus sp. CHD6a]
MQINKELLKGHIDTIILSLLIDSDLYGYRISQIVREKTNNKFELKEATLYISLKRLEKNKCLKSYWNHESGPGGRRKYYHITQEGKEVLKNSQAEWTYVKKTIDLFLEAVNIEEN